MGISTTQLAESFDNRSLHLILFPTEYCNFRCTYCYEDFKVGRMKSWVVSGVKRLISDRAATLQTLKVSWFGGEPLLARDIIYDVSSHVVESSVPHYVANISTNGYLLNVDTAARLASVGVTSYQISLDGPEEQHDRTRRLAGGSGTFARIWSNLVAIRRSNLELSILLRLHYSRENVDAVADLTETVGKEFGGDSRFAVVFKAIERLGGVNDASIAVVAEDQKQTTERRLRGTLAGRLAAREPQSDNAYICYAAKPNSLAIRANGSINKCTVALRDNRNSVGQLRPDGTLDLDQSKLRPWFRGFASSDQTELACPYARMI